jgi:preprotein translocase subunit YajC
MKDPTGMSFLISILLVFVVMYFLMLRPQAKRQKEREAMLKKIARGDRVVTTGGFFGGVVGVKGDDVLVIKFGDNRPIEVSRAAIAAIVGHGAVDGESA